MALLGLLWYLIAIAVWWLVGGVMGLSRYSHFNDLVFGIAIIGFFDIFWWLPYVSYAAIAEKISFMKYSQRMLPYLISLAVGLALFTLLALSSKGSTANHWNLRVVPAVAVTILYFIRRLFRNNSTPIEAPIGSGTE